MNIFKRFEIINEVNITYYDLFYRINKIVVNDLLDTKKNEQMFDFKDGILIYFIKNDKGYTIKIIKNRNEEKK